MSEEKIFKLLDYPIFSKGYGIASKYILCDPGLSVASKGDYCYKRSLCGRNNETVFPGVFKIMEDLGISKKLYYKARGELLNAGIIIIKQHKNSGTFDNNYYEFPLQPSRYMVATDDPYILSIRDEIGQFGVMAKYGLCPYAVMADKELSVGAKVIFAYISAHINVSEKPYAELDPRRIQYHLGMSPNTYQKYLTELKDHKLIIVDRVREGGAFQQKNRYAINYKMAPVGESDVPVTVISFPEAPATKKEETVEPPITKKEETVEPPITKKEETVEPPITKKEETVEPPITKKEETVDSPTTKQGETVKGETKKEETIITSSTITSSNQIILDRLIETVREKINYRIYEWNGKGDPLLEAADLLVDAIVEALTSAAPVIIINGQPLLTKTVQEELMRVTNTAAMNVLNRYLAHTADSIHNKKAYLLTSIYNEIRIPTKDEDDFYEAY